MQFQQNLKSLHMKFVISRNEIFQCLQLVNKVIPSKSAYPMLDNFKLEVKDNVLIVTGTDLQTTIISQLEIDNVEGQGSVAIEAKRLLDILKEFSEQPLIFEIDDETKNTTIYTQTGKYTIGSYSTEDYPEPPAIDPNQAGKFVVPSYILNRAISKTIFSVSNDEAQIVMTGILFELHPDNVTFVASDGHKLVRYTRTDLSADSDYEFILPKKPAELIRSIVAKYEGEVTVLFTDRNAVFDLGSYKIISRLIDGKFPEYKAVIPLDNPNKLTIDRVEFLNAIKRVSVFANEASKLVKFNISDNEVKITAQDIDFSISAEETLPAHYEGQPMKIGFKSTFILDILSNIDSGDVMLEMSEPNRAALILPTEKLDENEDVLMLLMPMMLDEDVE